MIVQKKETKPVDNQVKSTTNIDVQLMRDVQYRKELSIAYFNSLNSAITLATATLPKTASLEKKLATISDLRQHFLNEYKQYRVDILDSTWSPSIDPKVVQGLDKAKQLYANKT